MMQYYFRDEYEAMLCDEFADITRDYPEIRFFHPSPDKAPWHVQAVIDMADGCDLVLNFWPHKQKAQRQGSYALEGPTAARDIIKQAIADQAEVLLDSTAFDLIERD